MPVICPPRSPDEPVPGSPDEPCAALAAGAPPRLVSNEETSIAPTKTASDASTELTADAMRKLHFEEYTFDDRPKETTATRWGLRVRAYHVYAYSEGKMPIMLHGTMEGNAYYDQSGSQKFITSVAAALGRPYRSAPKASSVFFAFRGGRKVYEQDKFAHWNGMCALCSEHLPRWRRSCSSTSPVERFVWHCRE